MPDDEQAEAADDNSGVMHLQGDLNAARVADLWPELKKRLRPARNAGVTTASTAVLNQVDFDGLVSCDGAGISLLVWLHDAAESQASLRITGLATEWQTVVDAVRHAPAPTAPEKPEGLVTQIGHATVGIAKDMHAQIAFVGETTLALLWAARNPHQVRIKDALLIAEKTGVNAVPVVSLLGFLMGLIIAFQSAIPMKSFGIESMIPTIVGISMVRELGPLMTAILLAGRSGSAFAAEIGTMKVTEEINALKTFGFDPNRFLVVPRVLAAVAMTPLLSLFATLLGILGGYVVMAGMGYSFSFYQDQVLQAVTVSDFLQGVGKAGVFALLVAGVGCLRGLHTEAGPGAVGDSTTRSVVAGIVLIVIADGLLGVVFYYVGI